MPLGVEHKPSPEAAWGRGRGCAGTRSQSLRGAHSPHAPAARLHVRAFSACTGDSCVCTSLPVSLRDDCSAAELNPTVEETGEQEGELLTFTFRPLLRRVSTFSFLDELPLTLSGLGAHGVALSEDPSPGARSSERGWQAQARTQTWGGFGQWPEQLPESLTGPSSSPCHQSGLLGEIRG